MGTKNYEVLQAFKRQIIYISTDNCRFTLLSRQVKERSFHRMDVGFSQTFYREILPRCKWESNFPHAYSSYIFYILALGDPKKVEESKKGKQARSFCAPIMFITPR